MKTSNGKACVAGFWTLLLSLLLLPHVEAGTVFPWSQEGHDAAHTWSNSGPSPAANIPFWTSNAGGGIDTVGVVAQGLVFAHRADGIVALDEQTGAVVRTYAVAGPRNFAVSDGRLVVGDGAGTVRAFDVGNGSLLWSRATGPVNNIAVEGSRVFVNTGLGDGHLRALDVTTGNVVWDFVGVAGSSSAPTVASGQVYQNSFNDGKVLALNAATGGLAWQTTVGSGASSPVADGTRLFFGTTGGDLLALSQATGATLWDTSLGGEIYAGGAANGLAFAVSFSGIAYALNAETGAMVWSFNTGSGFQSSAMASADGRVFFSSQVANPMLFALNQSTGELLWSDAEAVRPIVADGLVFAVSGGDVVAIGAPVPEPSTLLLLSSGLAGLGSVAWRRHRLAGIPRIVRSQRRA